MGNRRNKPDRKGRSANRVGSANAVIIMRRAFWHSPQVSALSSIARSLIVELTGIYTGPNCHDRLFLSVKDAARRLGVSDLAAASAAFKELLDLGLLIETVPSHFAVKAGGKSRARAFRLAWKAEDGGQLGPDALPPLDFGALTPKQKRRVEQRSRALSNYAKSDLPVMQSRTLTDVRASTGTASVLLSNTLSSENGGNTFGAVVRDSNTHIYYQGGRGQRCPSCFTIFQPERPNQQFCKPACRRAGEYQRRKAANGWWASIEPKLDRIDVGP